MEFNLADLWEKVVDTVPDREAIISGDRRLTYVAADERANRLAHFLESRGVGPGDHVALYLTNGTEYLEGMLAAFKLRAVPVNVNYRYVEEELRYLLDDADVKAVVYHRTYEPTLAAVLGGLPDVHTLVVVEDGAEPAGGTGEPVEYEAALAGASPDRGFGPRTADDLYILYTGGTTGMPKGVMWRAEDVFFGALATLVTPPIETPEEIAERALEGRTRCLPACPFMHGTAHWMALSTLYSGGTVVISPERHLDPVALWELVAREKVNFLVIVGDAFARPLVEAIDHLDPSVDLSQCSVILSGGAILSPSVKALFVEKMPSTLIIDGYGSSESGGQGQSVTVAGSEVSSVPRFAVNAETTVLDENLQVAPPGVVGKLARRGRIPVGYYKDPEKTAATFPVVDGVRWSVPGDHARIDDDGMITLLGRGSVSINTGGEKVYPEEVEAALKGHPDVFDAVVVGVRDERWGERVVALVQPRPGAEPGFEDLDAHVRVHVAGYKAPRQVLLVDHIVRSPSGKPDYRWGKALAMERLGTTA
jgi:acyl-CoA synthetase (AMP-forming)/AMP-acid ligase II